MSCHVSHRPVYLVPPFSSLTPDTHHPTTPNQKQVRDGIARLVPLRHRSTGQELPHFARACPQQDLLAVALGARLELWRLHDLHPLLAGPDDAIITVPEGLALDPVMVAAFSPCGRYLAAAAHDGVVRLLKLEAQMEAAPAALASGGDGERRLAGLRVAARCEWRADEGGATTGEKKPYRDLAFHPGGRTLVGSCEDGSWRGWEIVEGSLMPPMLTPTSPRPPTTPMQQQQHHQPSLHLRPLFALPAATGLARAHTAGKPGSPHRDASVAAAVEKDRQQGVLYTCRCGRFTPDGAGFFSVHYARRGPKNTDKRPYLTKWRLELSPPAAPPAAGQPQQQHAAGGIGFPPIQGMTPVSCHPVGQDPLMCLALHPDGLHGAAGDCSGRTVHFRTADAKVVCVKEGMHNFGVTSLAFSPPPGLTGGGGGSGSAHPVRLASSSGDKTVRLQYWTPPAHLLAAAKTTQRSQQQQQRGGGRGGGLVRWVFGTAWALAWHALLAALLLGAWFCLCCRLHGVPVARGWDRVYSGVYEGSDTALRPYLEAATPYVGQAQRAWDAKVAPVLEPAWAAARPHWERARPAVGEGWGRVCVEVGKGLDRYWWPAWEAHWPVVRARVEGWVRDWSQGEL